MKRLLCAALLTIFIAVPTQASDSDEIQAAKRETVSWLSLTDTLQYELSWELASSLFQAAISKADWVRSLSAARSPFGALRSRKVASSKFSTTLPGAPDGEYVVFQFNSSFESKASALETVTAMRDADGVWRVAGYFIK